MYKSKKLILDMSYDWKRFIYNTRYHTKNIFISFFFPRREIIEHMKDKIKQTLLDEYKESLSCNIFQRDTNFYILI